MRPPAAALGHLLRSRSLPGRRCVARLVAGNIAPVVRPDVVRVDVARGGVDGNGGAVVGK